MLGRTADLLHSAFWWHNSYKDFFDDAGVPVDIVNTAYKEGGSKGRIGRSVLKQLTSKGPDGIRVAWRVIDAALALTGPVDADLNKAPFDEKRMKLEAALVGRSNRLDPSDEEKQRQAKELRAQQERDAEMEAIRLRFWELMTDASIEPILRGYELETILGRLCKATGVAYDPPLRQQGQQIDGAIKFEGRVLVIEARWRKDKADFGDIQKLSGKARARIVGTLGFFLSMEGFSTDGVDLWLQSGHQRDCILLQGSEFVKVVNGYVPWVDALRQMIDQASVRGQILVSLSL